MPDERSRRGVEVAERFADGLATTDELHHAAEAAIRVAYGPFDDTPRGQLGAYDHASMAAWWTADDSDSYDVAAGEVSNRAAGATVCDPDDPEIEDDAQCGLIRDIFGDPFLPFQPLSPSLLGWENGLVVKLAEAAYEHRSLPSGHLDNARLAVLADALTDAGCTDDWLLGHLGSDGPHVRGCAAIDLLTGRG